MSCPICKSETDRRYRPFCSKRCANLDLANWLNGSYAIPSAAEEEPETDPSEDAVQPPRPH